MKEYMKVDGYTDSDYYDLEFRQQNPDVYGYDEFMQDMYGDSPPIRRMRSFIKITLNGNVRMPRGWNN